MSLLVPAYSGCSGSKAVKRSLLLLLFVEKNFPKGPIFASSGMHNLNSVIHTQLESIVFTAEQHMLLESQ